MASLFLGALVMAITAPVSAGPKKPAPKEDLPDFDKTAAATALSTVDLTKCKTTNAPRGDGHVFVTFAPAGTAKTASLDKGPMMGTPVQKCIEKAFKAAKVPAFKGDNVLVGKNFKFD